MEILIEILKEIPAGIDRWLFIILGVILYFSPTIYAKIFNKNERAEKIQRIKSLLEIKNLALEIAIKERREFSEIPEIIEEKSLLDELFQKKEIEKYKEDKLSRGQRMKCGLIGSMSVVIVLLLINMIFSPRELDAVVIVLRDLGIGVISGVLMAFYPGNSKKAVITAGVVAPFILSMVLILFRLI